LPDLPSDVRDYLDNKFQKVYERLDRQGEKLAESIKATTNHIHGCQAYNLFGTEKAVSEYYKMKLQQEHMKKNIDDLYERLDKRTDKIWKALTLAVSIGMLFLFIIKFVINIGS